MHLPGTDLDGSDPLAATIGDDEAGDEPLVVPVDGVVLKRRLEEGVEKMETGFVGGVPRPFQFHPTEGADRDAAVGFTAPRASPMLQLQQLLGGVFDENLDGVLVGEPIGPRDRVVGMVIERVGWGDDGGGSAFGRDRMAPHRIDLRDHPNADVGMIPSYGDGRTKPCSTAPDDQNIMLESFHAH